MYVKLIKDHPSGMPSGKVVELSDDSSLKIINDGYGIEVTENDFKEYKESIAKELESKQAFVDAKIKADAEAALKEIEIIRDEMLIEIQNELKEQARLKAEAEAKVKAEADAKAAEINAAAAAAKAEAEARRIASLKVSIKETLLIEYSTGTDIFEKYKPVEVIEIKSKKK